MGSGGTDRHKGGPSRTRGLWEKEAGEQRVQPGDTAGTGARGLRVGPGASRPDPRPGSTTSGLGRLGGPLSL